MDLINSATHGGVKRVPFSIKVEESTTGISICCVVVEVGHMSQ